MGDEVLFILLGSYVAIAAHLATRFVREQLMRRCQSAPPATGRVGRGLTLCARLGMAIGWLCSRLSRSVDNGDPPPPHVECARCSGTHHFNGRSWETCAGCGAPISEPKPLPPEGLVPLEVFWR